MRHDKNVIRAEIGKYKAPVISTLKAAVREKYQNPHLVTPARAEYVVQNPTNP